MALELCNSYFESSWSESLEKNNDFDTLMNWVSAEFILYQQEDHQGIKVYFPNGWFVIRTIEEMDNEYLVHIWSKSKFNFSTIKEQLSLALHRFKQIKKKY